MEVDLFLYIWAIEEVLMLLSVWPFGVSTFSKQIYTTFSFSGDV